MVQNEVYDWLKEKREQGDNRYFSTKEIHLALNERNIKINISKVSISISKMYIYGFIEIKYVLNRKNFNTRCVRIKKYYCNTNNTNNNN